MKKEKKEMPTSSLLLNILYLLPLALEVFFPQADLVIAAAHRKNVSARAPADPPEDSIKLELLASPLTGV